MTAPKIPAPWYYHFCNPLPSNDGMSMMDFTPQITLPYMTKGTGLRLHIGWLWVIPKGDPLGILTYRGKNLKGTGSLLKRRDVKWQRLSSWIWRSKLLCCKVLTDNIMWQGPEAASGHWEQSWLTESYQGQGPRPQPHSSNKTDAANNLRKFRNSYFPNSASRWRHGQLMLPSQHYETLSRQPS